MPASGRSISTRRRAPKMDARAAGVAFLLLLGLLAMALLAALDGCDLITL